MNAVFVSVLPGRNGVPKHWRKDWLERRQVPHDAFIDQAVECGQESFFDERIDVFPVRPIPANEQYFFLLHFFFLTLQKKSHLGSKMAG